MKRRLFATAAAAFAAAPLPLRAQGSDERNAFVKATDGTALFVRSAGGGRAVVFLSGWCLPSAMWRLQFDALSRQGLHCIGYDRRGHGLSSPSGDGRYNIDRLADDFGTVLDSLDSLASPDAADRRELSIVAYSMGAAEAVRFLTRHPGRSRIAVRKLVLLAPCTPLIMQTADNPIGVPEAALAAARAAIENDFAAWLDRNEELFVVPATPAADRTWLKLMMLQTDRNAAVRCHEAMATADVRADLATLKMPSTVIQGDRDASLPIALTGQRTAALLGAAPLVVYRGAPHGLFLTHAERLNADLVELLA